MLITYLKSSPKFIVIQDNITQNASEILIYLISNQLIKEPQTPLLYYELEFNRKFNSSDFVTRVQKFNFMNGFSDEDDQKHAHQFFSIIKKKSVIVIDSLGHFIYKYGLNEAYKILDKLKKHKNVIQIITLLHKNLFSDDAILFNYAEDLGTLHIDLLPKFLSNNFRACYVYRKPGGKVISDIEEYYMENGNLITKPLEKFNAPRLVQENPINPDDLTTFRITLQGNEIESRNNLVLPYLPNSSNEADGGEIFYEFDEGDDWDEEDPDDDLDL